MGTSHSREGRFEDSDEETGEEEEEEEEEEELASGSASQNSFHSAKDSAADDSPQVKTQLLNLKLRGLSLSKEEPEAIAGPKVKLYHHVGANTHGAHWVVADKLVSWRFSKDGDEDDEDDEGDLRYKRGKKEHRNWLLVIGSKVRAVVDESLRMQFHAERTRVDLVYNGVWALKFPSPEEYQDFVTEYQNCLFENTHLVQATEENKLKVYGKDFIGWVRPDAADETIWQDAKDTFQTSRDKDLTESHREPTRGDGVQSLTMGVGEHSYIISDSEIGIYRNLQTGIRGKDSSIRLQHEDSYSTPKKGMLMRGETNLMLWSPAKEGKLHASGVNQLDIETGRMVAEWRFEKDGTPIQMRDITNDSKGAQTDPSGSTFLGLDDNRLCRWDMRDRHGVVQEVASPVLSWAEGHQFSRGTNFLCFASTGTGAVAVGSRDGKVRLYGTTSMRQAKTAFPGLGKAITHIDVTFDGKWILATTDTYMILISTIFIDKDGRQKTGFEARMGNRIAAPRLLKLNAYDAFLAEDYKFHGGQFSFVTESGVEEHNLVVSAGKFTLIWEFKRVKQDHDCYKGTTGLKTCHCYRVVPKEESVVESKFMHENPNHGSFSSPGAPLVVATPKNVSSFNF